MAEQLQILIVPHTHWDREWYQTFQQFRIRLVGMVDKLLNLLECDEKFSYFMLDGQTIVLDDYLEVRPEQKQRLEHYIRSGRVLVGPWYVQPDEFLVSGESLIRNLQLGMQRAADFGSPMRVGYVPDCFGHIGQLPQILRGCGIDNAVFWRGVGAEARCSEFYWEAPDGSQVLAIFLADPIGYSNARQLSLNKEEFVARVELLAATLLPKATTDMLLFMNGSDHLEAQEGLPAVIEAANAHLSHLDPQYESVLSRQQSPRNNYRSIRIQIGTLPQYIDHVRQQQTQFDVLSGELRSSQHAHLLPSVLSTRTWLKQQNTATEHLLERWVEPFAAWAALLGDNYPGGLIELAWRYLLQNHPHDSICGCSIDQVHQENRIRFAQSQQIGEGIVDQALQYIAAQVDTQAPLSSWHKGDEPVPIIVWNPGPGPRNDEAQVIVQVPGSLHNAVIVDENGECMPYRVTNRWRQEIGSMPIARETLASAVSLADIKTPEQLIHMAHSMIVSTLGHSVETHIISRIYIENYSTSPIHHVHHTPQPGIVYIEIMLAPLGRIIVDEHELNATGRQILDLLEREDIHTLEVTLVDQARETIDFLAANLPAYGFKTFWLYPRGVENEGHNGTENWQLIAKQNSIENAFYRVEVNSHDGTLVVTDKSTNVRFGDLNRFIDGGDVGDLYTYCPPERDTLISEPLEPVKVELLNPGPVRATLRVSGRWALPGACTANRTERSARSTICPIVYDVSLLPGVRRVDIHTSIENKVKDHRLRVTFPVPYKVENADAEGTFEVRRRPIRVSHPSDVSEWAEEPVSVFPQKRFVDLSDGKTGLGVLNRGLPEYEIAQNDKGQTAITLTLLRCVEWLSRGDLSTRHGHAGPMLHTPEAQCLGHHLFDYALVPHRGTWDDEKTLVLREAQAFNIWVATRAVVTGQHQGQLASLSMLIEIEPCELVLSSVKRSNDGQGFVVRLYNPLRRVVEAKLRPRVTFRRVYVANLLEEYVRQNGDKMEVHTDEAGFVRVYIDSSSIATLLFV